MSPIWIFRERRSGSTALSDYLSIQFNLPNVYISDFDKLEILDWQNKIVTTHNFNLLENLHLHGSPIILRCCRKDKFEQFISDFISDGEQVYNLYKNDNTILEKLSNAKPRKVFKQQYEIWKSRSVRMNTLWEQYAHRFINYTLYYEDMIKPVDIDVLGLKNCKILEESTTIKLPEYKKQLVLNYDEINEWFKDN